MFRFALHLDSRLAPKGKDQAWIHVDDIEGKLYCRYGLKEGALIDLNDSGLLVEEILPHGKLI